MNAWARTDAGMPWRDFLTPAERAKVDAADRAREAWEALSGERHMIQNRATARARYARQRELRKA